MYRPDIHRDDFHELLERQGFSDEDRRNMARVVIKSALTSYQGALDLLKPFIAISNRIAAEQAEAEIMCDQVFGATVNPDQGVLEFTEPGSEQSYGVI